MDCERLVYLAANEICKQIQVFVPEFEVGINSQAEARPSPPGIVSPTINVGYPEIAALDPNDRYYPRSGCECKFIPAVKIKCETWSGLIRIQPYSEYKLTGDQLVMHIENPKVFDWAVDRFMDYLEIWILKRVSPTQADIIARRRGKIQARRY